MTPGDPGGLRLSDGSPTALQRLSNGSLTALQRLSNGSLTALFSSQVWPTPYRNQTNIMGYSVRVDEWRYTAWFGFDNVSIVPVRHSDGALTALFSPSVRCVAGAALTALYQLSTSSLPAL